MALISPGILIVMRSLGLLNDTIVAVVSFETSLGLYGSGVQQCWVNAWALSSWDY
ncbi:MAG: hypothetical protein ACK6CP_23570 [Pseudanabaena sp.]